MNYHFYILKTTRENIVKMLDALSVEQLNAIPKGYKNNIVWNAGHMLVVQQLLVYRLSYLEPRIGEELIAQFSKGSKPEKGYSSTEIEHLKTLLTQSVMWLEEDYAKGVFTKYKSYTTGYNITLSSAEEAIMFNNVHESMHLGYAMAVRKLV
jgi:hypothetical protein